MSLKPSAVLLSPTSLTINDVTTTDPTVLDHARAVEGRGDDLATWVAAALAVGARAIGIASTDRDAAEVRAGLDRLADQVSAGLTDQVRTAVSRLDDTAARTSERLGSAVEAQVSRLALGVQGVLRDADGAMRDRVEASLRDGLGALRGALRDDAETTRQTVAAGLADLRAVIAVRDAREAVVANTHLKGSPYEDRVRAALEAVSGPLDLVVEDTTLATGETPGAKSGDFLLSPNASGLPGRGSIAVEVKSGARLTSGRWKTLLTEATRNRGTVCAIGVVPNADVLDGQLLRVLTPTSAVVAYDPDTDDPLGLLAAVVSLMQVGAIAQTVSASNRTGADRSALRSIVENIVRAAEGLAPLVRQAATLRRSAGDLHAGLDAAREELLAQIASAQRLIQVTAAATASPPAQTAA